MDNNSRDIISEETKEKQQGMKEKQVDDLFVDAFVKIYFKDGGDKPEETFPATEDLIVHVINTKLKKMPFDLQRRITAEIKKRTAPRRT